MSDKFCHNQPSLPWQRNFGTKSAITRLVQEISMRCLRITRGFWCRAIVSCQLFFQKDRPWLPWQRNLRQNHPYRVLCKRYSSRCNTLTKIPLGNQNTQKTMSILVKMWSAQCSTLVRNTVVKRDIQIHGKPPILGSRYP